MNRLRAIWDVANEEICRMKCLSCGYEGCDTAKDSCYKCGHRYRSGQDGAGEDCPKCGSDDYDTHCPLCDSPEMVYFNEYEAGLKDGTYERIEQTKTDQNT